MLKDDYLPKLNKWVHVGCITPSKIAKRKGKMGGSKSVAAVATALPQSSGVTGGERHKLQTPTAPRS